MGLFSGLSSALNPSSILGGGGGGGGSSSFSSGGIGSETGNTSNAGNSTATTTTTTTTNTDKRQVINSGGVGVATDSSPITVNNTSSDPQNYQALLAVTDHLASGTLMLMAANMDAANQAAGISTTTAADGVTQIATKTTNSFKDFYNNHKAGMLVLVAAVAYLVLRK